MQEVHESRVHWVTGAIGEDWRFRSVQDRWPPLSFGNRSNDSTRRALRAFEQLTRGDPTRSEAETQEATVLDGLPFGSMPWAPDRYLAAAPADSR